MALTNTDLFVVERGGTNYKMAADQLTAKTGATGASILPSGTSAERPTGAAGLVRFNTQSGFYEVYSSVTSSWRDLAYVSIPDTLPSLTPANGDVLPGGGSYESITINAGVTVTVSAYSSLYARSSIVINGTVNVSFMSPGAIPPGIADNVAEASIGGTAGQGTGIFGNIYGYGTQASTGARSGGLVVDRGSGTASAGGNGGGVLILKCGRTITMGAAGRINANGTPGGAAFLTAGTQGAIAPGGGGGSGGLIYLEAGTSVTLDAATRLSVMGGDGYPGFVGGSIAARGAGGGGGGGGGYIIVNAPVTSTTGANFIVDGGAAGTSTGVVADIVFLGANGAGWGGEGGTNNQGIPGFYARPGEPGQVLSNAYL